MTNLYLFLPSSTQLGIASVSSQLSFIRSELPLGTKSATLVTSQHGRFVHQRSSPLSGVVPSSFLIFLIVSSREQEVDIAMGELAGYGRHLNGFTVKGNFEQQKPKKE